MAFCAVTQDQMTIAFRDSLQSEIVYEQRKLWIHLPPGYSENLEYPVLYLLDGASNLRATVGVTSQLANMHDPDMIIDILSARTVFRL